MNIKDINPKRILIINTFGIGDVLFTTPLIANLKEHFPDSSISYLANRRTVSLLENHEHIDQVYIYERDEYNVLYKKSKIGFLKKVNALVKDLKKERFDIVFDFSLNRTASYLTWFVGIPHRVGFNYKGRSPLLTYKIPFNGFEGKHVVEFYLDVVRAVGLEVKHCNLHITIPEEDKEWAAKFLQDHNIKGDRKIVGILPGAGASWGKDAKYRRWDSARYAKLVDKIVEKFGCQIILMGDTSEADLCRKAAEIRPRDVISAYGQTSLGQLAALLQRCDAVVLNDGGPLHLAVSVQTKTVSIFGPVDDRVYGPFGDNQKHCVASKDIICRPCYRRFRMTRCDHISCLQTLTVEDVLQKVEQIL